MNGIRIFVFIAILLLLIAMFVATVPAGSRFTTSLMLILAAGAGLWFAQMRQGHKQKTQKNNSDALPNAPSVPISQLFLFNTLHNIQALMQFDVERANRTLEQLVDYIRAVMEVHRQEWIFFANEIKCIDLYLRIEGQRLGDRLHKTFDIADNCRELLVPGLLLQPLVEAAMRFGVEFFDGANEITLSARQDGTRLQIELVDLGQDFAAETESTLVKRKPVYEQVQKRLNLLYGAAAEFDYDAIVPSGCRVRLQLPLRSGL